MVGWRRIFRVEGGGWDADDFGEGVADVGEGCGPAGRAGSTEMWWRAHWGTAGFAVCGLGELALPAVRCDGLEGFALTVEYCVLRVWDL